jgi:DNA polymerase-3 subunit delta'
MLIGHKKQFEFLKKSAESDKLPHALLFYGQEKIGKKTLAVEFIKFLNCSEKNYSSKPCNNCSSCRDINKRTYPDLHIVEPESSLREIQIKQIRSLISELSLSVSFARLKTAIIDQAHLMTQEAQNCFLKLLEEPKGDALLILITEHPEVLLPTIVSRVQKIRLSGVNKEDIKRYLINNGITESKADYFSYEAEGRPGLSIDFSNNPQEIENRIKIISDFIKIKNSEMNEKFNYVKSFFQKDENSKEELVGVLSTWLNYLRGALISRIIGISRNNAEIYEKINKLFKISELTKIIAEIQTLNFLLLTTNANPKLSFENLLIKL